MADVLRLTYSELGSRLGLTPDGARFLARRRMWPIENGNNGRKLAILNEVELAAEVDRVADDSGMNGRSSPDDREVIGASGPADNILVADLRERLEKAEREVADLRAERDRLTERWAQGRERAAKAEG